MVHKLGGAWTAQKLGCVSDYAAAWAAIMGIEAPKWGWKTRYLDLFSGSGYYSTKEQAADEGDRLFQKEETSEEQKELQHGSARRAVEIEPKFSRIDLVELNPAYADELRKLAGDELNKRVFVHCEDVNSAARGLMMNVTRKDRILAFIDPYGCEVHWSTLEVLARSRVADVWYLFPMMGVSRQLAAPHKEISADKVETLNRVLGTMDWRDVFYKSEPVVDLLGEVDRTTRNAGPTRIKEFFLSRLETIFPYVHKDCLRLKNSRNGYMFSLCFAMGNESPSAIKAGRRLAAKAIERWEATN